MNKPITFYLGNNVTASLVQFDSGHLSLAYLDKYVDIAPTWNGLTDALSAAAADVNDHSLND